jgi:hypothetical protein
MEFVTNCGNSFESTAKYCEQKNRAPLSNGLTLRILGVLGSNFGPETSYHYMTPLVSFSPAK